MRRALPPKTRPPRGAVAPARLRMAERGIRRWLAPKPQEPAHGFLMRLAERHHSRSAGAFAAMLGVDSVQDVHACMLALSRSPLARPEHLDALRRWTPDLHGLPTRRNARMRVDTHYAFVTLGGETVRRGDWTLRSRRLCPACVAEDPYHRAWFDLAFVRECPVHGMTLTDVGPDGSTLGWVHASVDATTRGGSLAASAPRLEAAPDTLAAYALGRMGVATAPPHPWLDGRPLHEVIEAAEIMGRLDAGGRRGDMPLLQAGGFTAVDAQAGGWAILARGEDGTRRFFREFVDAAPPQAFGVKEVFGGAHRRFAYKEAFVLDLRRLMVEVTAEAGRHGRQRGDAGLPAGERLTVSELADAIGCPVNTAIHLATLRGCFESRATGAGTPRLVPGGKVDELRAVFEGGLTRSEAAAELRLRPADFASVVLAGLIPKIGTRWGGEVEDRFLREDLALFLDRIPLLDEDRPEPGMETFLPDHFRRLPDLLDATGYDAGRLMTDVLAGRLVPYARTSLDGGLASFRIAVELLPLRHGFTKRCLSVTSTRGNRDHIVGMSQKEAAAVLDVSYPTVKRLTELGHLTLADGTAAGGRSKLDRSSVDRLASAYVAGRLCAGALGCQPEKVFGKLRSLGLAPLIAEPPKSRGSRISFTPMYERRPLREILGLTGDPDDTPMRRVWKRVAGSLGRNNSAFMLWHTDGGRTALFSNSSREWPVYVGYDFENRPDRFRVADEVGYEVSATLRIGGRHGAERVRDMLRLVGRRRLPAAVRYRADPEAGTLDAWMVRTVPLAGWTGLDPEEFVLRHRQEDAIAIERMLHVLRACFQDGERAFENLSLGLWPTLFPPPEEPPDPARHG